MRVKGFWCASLALTLSFSAHGLQVTVDTEIRRLPATEDGPFRSRMALPAVSRGQEGLDPPAGRWITSDRAGNHVSKAAGVRLLDAARLALVSNAPVSIAIDDAGTHGLWCFASLTDILPAFESTPHPKGGD